MNFESSFCEHPDQLHCTKLNYNFVLFSVIQIIYQVHIDIEIMGDAKEHEQLHRNEHNKPDSVSSLKPK